MSEMRQNSISEDALKVLNVVGFNLWRYRQANMKHSVFKSKKMDPVVFVIGATELFRNYKVL